MTRKLAQKVGESAARLGPTAVRYPVNTMNLGTVDWMQQITIAERRRRLGTRHHLAARAESAEDVSRALVGLHSSDPATVYLGCQNRVAGFTSRDLERCLYDDRSLVRILGMRRTMFVVPPDLGVVANAACTQHLVAGQRERLVGYLAAQQIATDGDAWLRDVEERTMTALADFGQATARELKTVVPELGIKLAFGGGEFGLSTRVLFLLATANRIVRAKPLGGWTSTQYRWVRTDLWMPELATPLDPLEARADLARRWLHAYGPGTLNDIKWWTGWGIGATRATLVACGAVEVDLGDQIGYLLPDDHDLTEPVEPWAALLPSLDSTVMGWKDRDWYLGPHREELYDRNGNAGPTIWFEGRVVGGWAQSVDGEIRLEYLEAIPHSGTAMVEARAEQLQLWLADYRIIPRFRTPTEKRLVGSSR